MISRLCSASDATNDKKKGEKSSYKVSYRSNQYIQMLTKVTAGSKGRLCADRNNVRRWRSFIDAWTPWSAANNKSAIFSDHNGRRARKDLFGDLSFDFELKFCLKKFEMKFSMKTLHWFIATSFSSKTCAFKLSARPLLCESNFAMMRLCRRMSY